MKIALGCDHGGYAMKEDIKKQLEGLGHEVKDCGTYSTESCDYPIFGEAAARASRAGSASTASSSARRASVSLSRRTRSRVSVARTVPMRSKRSCAASTTTPT